MHSACLPYYFHISTDPISWHSVFPYGMSSIVCPGTGVDRSQNKRVWLYELVHCPLAMANPLVMTPELPKHLLSLSLFAQLIIHNAHTFDVHV